MIKHKENGLINPCEIIAYKPIFSIQQKKGYIFFILKNGGEARWEFETIEDRDEVIKAIDLHLEDKLDNTKIHIIESSKIELSIK